MARKRLVPVKNPDYYLKGRERRIRREAWEWPEAARHPAVGVCRAAYSDGWDAYSGGREGGTRVTAHFSDRRYGGTQESLDAAIAWRDGQVKKRGPGFKSTGWKLSPDKAGNVILLESKNQAIAKLVHDTALCRQAFSWGPRTGITKEHAIALAEMALEIWREEAQRIAKMPRHQQERIAARGGWTQRRGFPMTRQQMDLPLDG